MSSPLVSVNLEFSISPLLFGNGVVSFNQQHGVLFGAVVPEDFFLSEETKFVKYLNRDLQLLLRMPFNHFLSHILYDENLKKTLSTFFLYAPRVFESPRLFLLLLLSLGPTKFIAPIYNSILRVYYRLIVDETGPTDFSKTVPPFGGLGSSLMTVLFDKSVLSVEVFIDLCSLFGVQNRGILGHMLDKTAESYPKFRDEVIGFMKQTCDKLEETEKSLMDVPQRDMKDKQLAEEYVIFISDIVWNLSLLLQIAPWVGVC